MLKKLFIILLFVNQINSCEINFLPDEIFEAEMANNFDKVKYYLSIGGDVNALTKDGYSLLGDAACKDVRYIGFLKYLLARKDIDVNIKGRYGMTPLLYASARGCWWSVDLLLKHGADINCKENSFDEMTALMRAAYWCHLTTVLVLLDHNPDTKIKNKYDQDVIDILDSKIKDWSQGTRSPEAIKKVADYKLIRKFI